MQTRRWWRRRRSPPRILKAVAATVCAGGLALGWTTPAWAHGAGHAVIDRPVAGSGIGVSFFLSSGEALADANLKVFGPDDGTRAFLDGRTDRLGRAVFLPDRAGRWQIEVTDDQGHAAHAVLEVSPELAAPVEPLWRRWLPRLSLLANFVLIGLLLHVWLGRRDRAAGIAERLHQPASTTSRLRTLRAD